MGLQKVQHKEQDEARLSCVEEECQMGMVGAAGHDRAHCYADEQTYP